MASKKQKRRPEIMKPGLKQLTPLEIKFIDKTVAEYKALWARLLMLNKYEPHPKPRK